MNVVQPVESILIQISLLAQLQHRTLKQIFDDCDPFKQRFINSEQFKHFIESSGFGLTKNEINVLIESFTIKGNNRNKNFISLEKIEEKVQQIFQSFEHLTPGNPKSSVNEYNINDDNIIHNLMRRLARIRSNNFSLNHSLPVSSRSAEEIELFYRANPSKSINSSLTLDNNEIIALLNHFTQCQQSAKNKKFSQSVEENCQLKNSVKKQKIISSINENDSERESDRDDARRLLPMPPPSLPITKINSSVSESVKNILFNEKNLLDFSLNEISDDQYDPFIMPEQILPIEGFIQPTNNKAANSDNHQSKHQNTKFLSLPNRPDIKSFSGPLNSIPDHKLNYQSSSTSSVKRVRPIGVAVINQYNPNNLKPRPIPPRYNPFINNLNNK